MEEKKILENIISKTENFISGLTSFGKKDPIERLKNLLQTIKSIAEQKPKLSEDETEELLKILITAARPAFAKNFLAEIDEEVFYDFGSYLNERLDAGSEKIILIAHEYLNLFRYPSFLKKINKIKPGSSSRMYTEEKWVKLIYELILKSNYNLNVLLNQRLRDYRDKPLFRIIKGNSVTALSWEKSVNLISKYQKALKKLSGKVAFLLENSLEMALLDLACLTGGVVNIMIPSNSVTEHIKFILEQTEAEAIIVHNEKLLSKIKGIKNDLPFLKHVILLSGNSSEQWVTNFAEFNKTTENIPDDKQTDMQALATIMYTSGTTGEPKGIMFSQMNIVYKRFCRAMAIPEIGDEDRFLSYLPLFHTFGRYLEMTGSVFWASEYCFLENPSVEAMITNMQLVKPSVFISIPKKWMQLYEYITSKVDIEVDDDEKIKREVDSVTGGKLKWGLSAAGYLPADIFQFFQIYGIELMSGFGMTEATGGITMTPPGKYKPNSLGIALPGMEIKLGDDGEILIKGHYVMMGYYDEEPSKTFTEDGWLPSGDIMKMDEEGFIEIIDRKKEIYKNIRGETIAPQKIENLFRDFENVKQVFVAGDHRQFNTALIYPNLEDKSSPLHNMDEKQRQEYFSSVIVTVNKFLAPYERMLDFRIIDRPFSDAQSELTPKGTYKRKAIVKNFSDLIDSMYEKNHTSIVIDKTEVRIPNWFLREKGSLSRDIVVVENKIVIPKLNLTLKVNPAEEKNVYRIGSYYYKFESTPIDLQFLLTDPVLWIGNEELIDFTGSSIIQWYRQIGESKRMVFHSIAGEVTVDEKDLTRFDSIFSASEYSLQGIHLAYSIILSNNRLAEIKAIEYLNKIVSDEKSSYQKLVLTLLSRPGITSNIEARRKLFETVIQKADDKQFKKLFEDYIEAEPGLLDAGLAESLAEIIHGGNRLNIIEQFIEKDLNNVNANADLSSTPLLMMLRLITEIGIKHPVSYRRVRRFLMRPAVLSLNPVLKKAADKGLQELQNGFRTWIGPNQKVSIDIETGNEYRWEDVMSFEEGIDAEDRMRIKNALTNTQILREAIFFFSRGIQLRLDSILPNGIWISLLQSKKEKSIYRLTVQTRFQGGFDLTMHLNKNLPPAVVQEEVKWLILAGTTLKDERLLPHFGGYWEEYDLWTEEFVPRDSVEKFLERETRRKEDGYEQRLFELWPHFVWNSSAAYMQFWKLTNYNVQLANPLPVNVTVPTHDYQTGTLLYSVSKRLHTSSPLIYFMNFYNLFVKDTLDRYSFLDKKSIWNYIFSGVTECEGEEKGEELVLEFINELNKTEEFINKKEILRRATDFIHSLEQGGFIPRPLFFAIKRFHRWQKLNADADMFARAEMLYELYDTYRLFDLENEHPSTRTVFFHQTVFSESSEQLRNELNRIAKKQFSNELTKEETQKQYSELRNGFDLNEEEQFFLTRLSFPHLKPKDSAILLPAENMGIDASNLAVQHTDQDGNAFLIRNPISPKEISRLQALFLESNLNVNFREEHKFLVALSERGFIIAGLYYYYTDEQTAHMEKIVVSSRYRRKGISEKLMLELFERLRSEHTKFITTGFFRPEYFYKFGFRIEKKYSGLVMDLNKN